MKRDNWEYRVISESDFEKTETTYDLTKYLDDLGMDGWEMIGKFEYPSIQKGYCRIYWTFKRKCMQY